MTEVGVFKMKKQVSIKRKAKPIKSRHASLIAEIKHLVEGARQSIVQKINTELLITYWNVGKLIVLKEEQDNIDEKSSRQLIIRTIKRIDFSCWERIFSLKFICHEALLSTLQNCPDTVWTNHIDEKEKDKTRFQNISSTYLIKKSYKEK